MPDKIDGRSGLMRWSGLLILSAIFVVVLELLHVPAALLLGPMLAAIIFATTVRTMHVSALLAAISQALIGCMIARMVPLSILGEIVKEWPIFVIGVISVIIAGASLGWLLARLQVLPGTTAIWGSMPGGASAMTIMAASFGADMRLVAFMQYLRVVCVAIAASTISRIWVGPIHPGAQPQTIWFPPLAILPLVETAALIAVCIVLSRKLKITAGIFLLPMIFGMVLQNTGVIALELPPWLLAASYAVIGWTIGGRFSRDILVHVARAFPQVLGSIVLLIAICCVFAAVLVYFAGVDPLTAYLATSPGGADSVAIIAASTHVDVPFIMAMQLARMFVILLAGPVLARKLVRWSGLIDALPEPAVSRSKPIVPNAAGE